MKREDDRRGVNCLCPLLHQLHVVDCERTPTMKINGNEFPTIDNANMIWIKKEFDPEFYDIEYITRIWACNPPEPKPLHNHWLQSLRDSIGLRVE